MREVGSMLNNPTVEKLRDLKLKVMAQMLGDPDNSLRELSFEDRLAIMVEKEWMQKKNSRIKRLLDTADLGLDACMEDIDYAADRKIDKKVIQQLSTCAFIEQNLNVIISEKLDPGNPTFPAPSDTQPAGMAILSNITGFRSFYLKSRMPKWRTDTPDSCQVFRNSNCSSWTTSD